MILLQSGSMSNYNVYIFHAFSGFIAHVLKLSKMFSGWRSAFTYARYTRLKEAERAIVRWRQLQSTKLSTSAEKEPVQPETESWDNSVLYPGHRPTTLFQKALLTVGSAAMSLYDPSRGDMIATLGDVTAFQALKTMKRKMEEDPVGQQILHERPIITTETVSIEYLGSLPENTFGKEYWRFLSLHGFSPDARLPVHFVDDPELMYVMLRYRQCHDLFHTILGMRPNMLGEVAVKWVESIQTGLPMCTMGAVFGPLRLGPKHRQKYLKVYQSWAIRNGQKAKFLMCVYFEKHWERDLEELRMELNIDPPPEDPYPAQRAKSATEAATET